ncbi:hypothetical protein D3C72_2005930 [compost metagenome]
MDLDGARVWPYQAGDDGNEGGLAGAVGTEQAEKLAFFDGQRHAAQRLERFIALFYIRYLNCGHVLVSSVMRLV